MDSLKLILIFRCTSDISCILFTKSCLRHHAFIQSGSICNKTKHSLTKSTGTLRITNNVDPTLGRKNELVSLSTKSYTQPDNKSQASKPPF